MVTRNCSPLVLQTLIQIAFKNQQTHINRIYTFPFWSIIDVDIRWLRVPCPLPCRVRRVQSNQTLPDRFAFAVEKTKVSKKLSKAAASQTTTKEKLLLYAWVNVCPANLPQNLARGRWRRMCGPLPDERGMEFGCISKTVTLFLV